MQSNYEGHIDHSGFGTIFGWARDLDRPQERLTVEVTLSNGWKQRARAQALRPDLAEKGIGDGRYGFELAVPFSIAATTDITVSATTGGGAYRLLQSGRPLVRDYPISYVAGDITNNCNLRCPFCVTDYGQVKGLKSMDRETFQKSLSLLPMVPNGMFWLSCMHEPTIHPDFERLVSIVPSDQRNKISFTTNFCKRQPDSALAALADSGFDNIRISIDSVDSDRFADLRKGGHLKVFLDNLDRFAATLGRSLKPPKIHFITMAFADNCHEIEQIIRVCGDRWPARTHEVRFIFYMPHIADWGSQHILPLARWKMLKDSIQKQPDFDFVSFFDPIPETFESFAKRSGTEAYQSPAAVFGGNATPQIHQAADPLENGAELFDEPIPLRLRWDGLLKHDKLPEAAFLRYAQNTNPEYFARLRAAAAADGTRGWERCEPALSGTFR